MTVSIAPTSPRRRLLRWLRARADEAVLRALLGVILVTTATVIGLDYTQLRETAGEAPTAPGISRPAAEPLPSVRRGGEEQQGSPSRRADAKLKAPMSFDLVGSGRLMAVGTIEPGTAEVFAREIAKRGDYVKTIVLHSPGGSVSDALAMGRLIRQRRFATEVESGNYCASSCPLVFAGGIERRAGEKASIGVHQVFALPKGVSATGGLADGMDNAQRISAECQRYLRDMGIDLEVWVRAMETPKEQLYYFKADELTRLKLATQQGSPERKPAAGQAKS
jgi:hypothetical protein